MLNLIKPKTIILVVIYFNGRRIRIYKGDCGKLWIAA